MYVLGTLGPIILIIALGFLLRRGGFADQGFFRQTNRLVFWLALPCLLFAKTAGMTPDVETALTPFLVMLGGTLAALPAAIWIGRRLALPPPSQAAFVQGAYRGNLAYVGLPVVLFALAGRNGASSPADEAIAVLAIAPLILVYNVAAVWGLVRGSQKTEQTGQGMKPLLVSLCTNPILLGIVCGLGYAISGLPLPKLVYRTVSALGQLALPLALLGIGASLSLVALRGHVVPAIAGTLVKVVLSPLAGWLVGSLLGASPRELFVALLFLACPTATASYVMAERMKADAPLAASIVVLSTVVAMPVLAVILAGF